jgi:hypothetical protein
MFGAWCGHVFGLLMQPEWMAAGPDVVRFTILSQSPYRALGRQTLQRVFRMIAFASAFVSHIMVWCTSCQSFKTAFLMPPV